MDGMDIMCVCGREATVRQAPTQRTSTRGGVSFQTHRPRCHRCADEAAWKQLARGARFLKFEPIGVAA